MSYFTLENVPESSYTGESITYKIGSVQSNYGSTYYNLRYNFSSGGHTSTDVIATKQRAGKYEWTPMSEIFAPKMINSDRGTLTIIIESYDSRGIVRHTESKSFILILDLSITPQISNIRINRTTTFNGNSISGITFHSMSMGVKGLYNARQRVSISVNGKDIIWIDIYSASGSDITYWNPDIGYLNYESDDINSSSVIDIQITSKDTRGRSVSVNKSVTVYPYSPPSVSAKLSWNENEKAVLDFSYIYQDQVSGVANAIDTLEVVYPYNNLVHTYDLKDKSSPCVLDEDLDIAKSHTFYINIKDKVLTNAVQQKVILPSMNLVMDIGADGKTVTFFGTSPSSADEITLRIGDYASFGKKVRIGNEQNRYTLVDENGLQILNGADKIAHIGYGDCLAIDDDGNQATMNQPYYTFGERLPYYKTQNGIERYALIGAYSHAEGYMTIAEGPFSHAEGFSCRVGQFESAHAEGEYTYAWNDYAHAEGLNSRASGSASHAEGSASLASGYVSHAEGEETQATGEHSHAGGLQTIASGNEQTAIGRYNKDDASQLFIIGNGSANDARKNAFTVSETGDITSTGNTVQLIKNNNLVASYDGTTPVLLSTAVYPNADYTGNFSAPVSTQPHGILIEFAPYVDGQAKGYGLVTFFIPKGRCNGESYNIYIDPWCSKWIYVYDDKIVGNDANSKTGTMNGISYNNRKYVLSRVYGV